MLIIDMPIGADLVDRAVLYERLKQWQDAAYDTLTLAFLHEVKMLIGSAPHVKAVELVRCGECGHYHSEDDPAFCDELCTIHIEPTDGCLRGIKRGGKVGYCAADGERKDGAV